mgnify:CR=1 FL=1
MAESRFGKAEMPGQYRHRAPCVTSPTVEATASEAVKSVFESPVAHQFAGVAQRQRPAPQKRLQWAFESPRRHQFTLREPDGKAPVLHTGKTRLDPATEYQETVNKFRAPMRAIDQAEIAAAELRTGSLGYG